MAAPPTTTTTTAAARFPITGPPSSSPFAPAQPGATTAGHTQGDFRVWARKGAISKSGAIDAMSARLGIPIPEMIFGDNAVAVEHMPTRWRVEFAAEPALDAVDKTGERGLLRVAHADEWSGSRESSALTAGIHRVVRPYDWSYSTTYRGGETPGRDGLLRLAPDPSASIPLELLRRRDPILFADEVVLYESELDDNGTSALTVKMRVMPQRLLLLCRLFMRLDGVVCRVRDTRLYADFASHTVIREYTAKEDTCDNVKAALLRTGLLPDAVTVAMRDPIKVDGVMPTVEHEVESVTLR